MPCSVNYQFCYSSGRREKPKQCPRFKIVMAGKMQENLDETVSSDINNNEERPENNSDGTNNKGRMFSVGNQGRCAKQKSKRVYSKKRR